MDSRKYSRTYHFPFSQGATNDDRVQANWKQLLDKELVMTEKLDGENTCVKDLGVFARSHAAPTINPWAKNMQAIWTRLKSDLGNLEIFGENLFGVHSIEYEHLTDYFFVFAIRQGDEWLSWNEIEEYCFFFDLKTVPIVKIGHFQETEILPTIETELMKGSAFGGACEGFVFRNKDRFHVNDFSTNVLKYVRKNHVQTDEHWTKNWKRAKLFFEKNEKLDY
jgi:RNA ligase